LHIAKRKRGFSLIQVSIILTVASIVMVNALPASKSTSKSTKETSDKTAVVMNAFRSYMANNGTLPCPADPRLAVGSDNYGVKAANNGATNNCMGASPAVPYKLTNTVNGVTANVAIGMIPVKSLGLSKDYALDSYGRNITYMVDTRATETCWNAQNINGAININENGNTANSVMALVNHGANGQAAWMPLSGSGAGQTVSRFNNGSSDSYEMSNAQATITNSVLTPLTTFATLYNKPATPTFDDVVIYKSPLWAINQIPNSVLKNSADITMPTGNFVPGEDLIFSINFPNDVKLETNSGANIPYIELQIANLAARDSSSPPPIAQAMCYNACRSDGTCKGNCNTAAGDGLYRKLMFKYTIIGGDTTYSNPVFEKSVKLDGSTLTVNGKNTCPNIFNKTAPATIGSMSGVTIDGTKLVISNTKKNENVICSPLPNITSCSTPAQIGGNTYRVSSSAVSSALPPNTRRIQVSYDASGAANPSYNVMSSCDSTWENCGFYHDENNNQPTGVSKYYSSGIAIGNSGCSYNASPTECIWITNTAENQLQYFSMGSSSYTKIDNTYLTSASGIKSFKSPTGVTTDKNANAYITDTGNNRIIKFNKSRVYQWEINPTTPVNLNGVPGVTGIFNAPTGITSSSKVSGNGFDLWIADSQNNRVIKCPMPASGLLPSPITCTSYDGSLGSTASPLTFNNPTGIAYDIDNDQVYVVDGNNKRVIRLNGNTGAFSASICESYPKCTYTYSSGFSF